MRIEIVVITALIIYILANIIKKGIEKIKIKQNFKKGIKGEKRAAVFLKKNGYKIIDYQKELRYNYLANNEKIEVRIRPDYIVKRAGKTYVAEVKTGKFVSNYIKNSQTRRQLLEYDYATDNYGTLLIDIEKEKIIKIDFRKKKNHGKHILPILLVISILINILLYYTKN